jgi:CheY-like chemotaxis protein
MSHETKSIVLVVDDDPDTRQVVRWMLEEWGYFVLEAADGRQALEVAEKGRPDVVLMDLAMPVVDGFDAIRSIRKHPALKDTPVIALTAFDMAVSRNRAEAAGADYYLSKPVDFRRPKMLLQKLTREKSEG